jgi:hypothetical protein
MKKLTIFIALMAAFVFAGNAAADVYKINLAGASAQADFWRIAGEAYLLSIGCDTREITGTATNGVIRGTGCNWPGAGDSNTIMLGYLAIASDAGCTNASGCDLLSMCDPNAASTTWSSNFSAPGSCTAQLAQPVHLGAADVPCNCITQTSSGYPNGYCGSTGSACCDHNGTLPTPFNPNPAGWTNYSYNITMPATMVYFASVAVPFGFLVNDSVQAFQCVAPDINTSTIAYDSMGNFCEPTGGFAAGNGTSADCQGYAQCLSTGVCASGPNVGLACSKSADCPGTALANTSCQLRPVQNLSRIQLVQLFSRAVTKWTDLGPWFNVVSGHASLPGARPAGTPWWPTGHPNAGVYENNDEVVLCMRHAGSGTHATMNAEVMRSDATLKTTSDCANVFHYRSSGDLTSDCVNRFPGAIGYVDADKLIQSKANNIHFIKYEGVEATRKTVANCDYPFFAEQQTFYDSACVSTTLQNLAASLNTFAANPANLTTANFGATAKFWATQDELKCSKGTTCGGCGLLPRP